eukprot:gnl/TRDRNA2_/TRDRNA2_116515_c2_seq1.p1 gnl/TRDRNA2_/TRDRNA2_116515_c2~~gnl/TRDRNA2_/TRDRNA2_116515_c2_seq1.p1  ORF type:complete len:852 (-),score=157.45 gnl/TRDRNA2_/TRDRNA2_116515_c2_seq1:198-2564(-)
MLYSHLPGGGHELISRMCCHYLRDEVSNITVGAPWKLIRGEARPEDVCQGALGNCWFAGALSVVARLPQLIEKLFLGSRDYNPQGAYQLRLFYAGEWRRILVDDLLPTSQIFEGTMDGQYVYYSRGGGPAYLHGARRQLWVPLVEKAAAKLFGSYGAMKGGTFGEALSLFTGAPVQRLHLYIPKAVREERARRRDAIAEARTQMLLQGKDPDDPVNGIPQDDEDDEAEDSDLIWSKLLSFNESGYLMGMGCTEQGCEKPRTHIVEEMGLQAPHAYGVLDVREVKDKNGRLVRMMKIRNPWGERAPRTWKGKWGKGSDQWTFELKLELGVVNRSNVQMEDDMSIFWMEFSDVREYFAAIEVCRVHCGWSETRCRGWLPSAVGPGEAFELKVWRRTQVDITLWQEKHILREGALGARSTNIDVGFAVMRVRRRKEGLEAMEPELELVEYIRRNRGDDLVSQEMILDGGFVYRIIPLSFGLAQDVRSGPRRGVITVHSVQPVQLKKVASSWESVNAAIVEGAVRHGRKRGLQGEKPGLFQYMLSEPGGVALVAENPTQDLVPVQVDTSESFGCVSSMLNEMSIVTLQPQTRQVLCVLAFSADATRGRCAAAAATLPLEAAAFVVNDEGSMHRMMPILVKPPPAEPDPEILKEAPPEVPLPGATPKNSGSGDPSEDEEMLAAALRLSMEGRAPASSSNPAADPEDEDDALAAAIAMSMQASPTLAPAPAPVPAPAPAPAATGAAAPEVKAAADALKVKVKELFEQYRQAGMAPQEAAVKAMKDAKAAMAGRP